VFIGAGEGNRTLVFSLEGCRALSDYNARSDKSWPARPYEPSTLSAVVRTVDITTARAFEPPAAGAVRRNRHAHRAEVAAFRAEIADMVLLTHLIDVTDLHAIPNAEFLRAVADWRARALTRRPTCICCRATEFVAGAFLFASPSSAGAPASASVSGIARHAGPV
jgi:hypothetical protein